MASHPWVKRCSLKWMPCTPSSRWPHSSSKIRTYLVKNLSMHRWTTVKSYWIARVVMRLRQVTQAALINCNLRQIRSLARQIWRNLKLWEMLLWIVVPNRCLILAQKTTKIVLSSNRRSSPSRIVTTCCTRGVSLTRVRQIASILNIMRCWPLKRRRPRV